MGAVEIGAGHIYRERIGGAAPLFLGSLAEPERASIVLLGAPFDGTTSFVPGTRFGPARVREASIGLESYSPALDRTLEEAGLADVGDLELPFGNVSAALERIEGACRAVVAMGAKPFLVGGEHLVTLPAVRACHSRFKDLAVVQFDAHADLRDQYLGEHDSHATVMRRVAEVVGAENLYQIGIRSGTREEFAFGRAFSAVFTEDVEAGAARAAEELAGRPVYLTVDIDVVDPGFAPGTGTPEPGGCRPQELLAALWRLRDLDVVGFDVVEVNPLVDTGFVTSLLAAKVVREAAIMFGAGDREDVDGKEEDEAFGR
ncbi:MAG: agmatinase [Firmicutes bacterium]|nr:agmatinase [Bacillota bacterium]MBO2520846.1 agmatinase [Bacillota bacterium]